MSARRVSVRHHVMTFVALAALATVSLLVGRHLPRPAWGVTLGLTVALGKTLLVLWFFMHMAEQPFRTGLLTSVAVLLVVLLVALTSSDVATRSLVPRGTAPALGESFYER